MTCGASWKQGTLDGGGGWTAGAGRDYRVVCTGDANRDTLDLGDLPPPPAGAGRLIADIADANIDFAKDDLTDVETARWVLTGALGAPGGDDGGLDIDIDSFASPDNAFTLESFAAIHASEASTRGIRLRNRDTGHTDHIVAINHGAITTSGEDWARGMEVRTGSRSAEAHARAVNKGTVSTSGAGASGVYARVGSTGAGTATAVNEGRIETSGGYKRGVDGSESRYAGAGADGLRASNDGSGKAQATNEAGGVIEVSGGGARGIWAWAGNGAATATNRGTVTATGDSTTASPRRTAGGVTAGSVGGVARAVNEVGGKITTGSKDQTSGALSGGTGWTGIRASNEGSAGEARAVNRGSVTTYGDMLVSGTYRRPSNGMRAWSARQSAYGKNSGDIRTEGRSASGLSTSSQRGGDGEKAVAVNSGDIVTTGGLMPEDDGSYAGAGGVFVYTGGGAAAKATNEAGGSIDVGGDGVRGIIIYADNFAVQGSASGDATAENSGRIVTRGDAQKMSSYWNGAHGIMSWSADGTATARNRGAIDTHGLASYGVFATSVKGDAVVKNAGTITTHATESDATLPGEDGRAGGSHGLYAGLYRSNAGNVKAVNTGAITVSGAGTRGIKAITFGAGRATVLADGGRVTASHDDADDANDGVGIHASSGAAGGIDVTVRNGAVIDAPQALLLEGAPATVAVTASELIGRVTFGGRDDRMTVNAGILRGPVAFGDGADTLRVRNNGYFEGGLDFGAGNDMLEVLNGGYFGGDIDFGAGTDTLRVTNGGYFAGAITGLTDFTGSGGEIRLDAVTFSGSSATFTDDAELSIFGAFDLGDTGTMTIHDGSRVQLFATTTDDDKVVLPQIRAGGGVSCRDGDRAETGCTLYLQNDLNTQATAGEMARNAVSRDTELSGEEVRYLTRDDDGNEELIGTAEVMADGSQGTQDIAEEAKAHQLEPPAVPDRPDVSPPTPDPGVDPKTPVGSGSGGGGSRGAVVGAGLLALVFTLFDFGPDEAPDPAAPKPAFVQAAAGESRWWTRNLASGLTAGGGVGGVEIGMDLAVGNGFSLGFATAPEMAAKRRAGADAAALSGGRYSLRGGWRGERLFAGLSLSHADWRVNGSWENPTVGGGMQSHFDAAQRDLRLSLGARLDLGGGMTLVPQAEAFAGELERESHMAEGAVFRAAMPGLTQRYRGVKAGLGFASGWREAGGEVKLRPTLNLSAMRVRTGSESFEMKQSDRLGILSTGSRARLADAPETAFGLGAGLEAAGPGGLRMGFGYAGLVVDGELHHAAAASLHLPF